MIVKLKRKYRKKTTSPLLQHKHRAYVKVLETMGAKFEDDGIDSVQDYARVWVNRSIEEDFVILL